MTRRDAARKMSLFLAGSPLLRAQEPAWIADRLPAIEALNNVMEFEPVARARMLKAVYDYVSTGVDDEWTLRRNRLGFERVTLRPRMLVDVSKLDLSLELFGSKIEMPILIAPTGGHQAVIMVVSTASSYPIDKIGAAATGPFWFQLYTGPDKDATREKVERAVEAGAKAVCLTVDGQYMSHREKMIRDRLSSMGAPSTPASGPLPGRSRTRQTAPAPYRLQSTFQAQLTWPFVDELTAYAKVPVLIKGVLTGEDAKLAIEHGAAGIVVSNHGGRYLEYAPSTIEVLPEIVEAVQGKIPVLLDGGVRRGTDVLKALAIGAKAVLVGRPPLWGLGAFGQPGVTRVLEMLQTELALAMGLSGVANLDSIKPSLVRVERTGVRL